jgi:hypothetical protein
MFPRSRFLAGAACAAALLVPACASGGYGPGYPDRDAVILFDGENHTGATLPIDGPVPDLVPLRFNDAASSVVIYSGSWEFCEDSNFRGRCEVLTGSVTSLRGVRLNDAISSIRPVGGAGYPPVGGYGSITLFSSAGLRGDALTIDRNEPNLARAGFNDRARSIDVRGGVWEVCVDGDYRGRCTTVDRPVSDLRDLGLSGTISSVRLLDGPRGY